MKYLITFACGAIMETAASPEVTAGLRDEAAKTAAHLRTKRGFMPTLVCSVRDPHAGLKPILPDGESPPCVYQCPKKRLSGRSCYQVFPDDYDAEKGEGGKYRGKSFFSFCWTHVTCFPMKVEKRGKDKR